MNHLNIKIPIFNDRCHVFWPYTKADADKWLKIKKYDTDAVDPKHCVGFTTYSPIKGNGAAIFLRGWKGSIKDMAVLVHEAVHAASFIRAGLGVDETPESAEVLCYLTDYITQKALKAMGRRVAKDS